MTDEWTSGGTLDALTVTNQYDSMLKRTVVGALKAPSTWLANNSYSYDAASRLYQADEGTESAT